MIKTAAILDVSMAPTSGPRSMQAAQKDLPNLDKDIAAGRFTELKSWLNEKIHKSGSLHPRQVKQPPTLLCICMTLCCRTFVRYWLTAKW